MTKGRKILTTLLIVAVCVLCVIIVFIWYFGKGKFNSDVYNRICSNIKIGDITISMPFTVDELGDEFDIKIKSTYKGSAFGYIMHDEKIVMNVGADIIGDDVRKYPIDFVVIADYAGYYGNNKAIDDALIKDISVDGIKCGASKRDVIRKYGKPAYRDDFEIDGEEFGYYPGSENFDQRYDYCPIIYKFDKTGESGKVDYIYIDYISRH